MAHFVWTTPIAGIFIHEVQEFREAQSHAGLNQFSAGVFFLSGRTEPPSGGLFVPQPLHPIAATTNSNVVLTQSFSKWGSQNIGEKRGPCSNLV